MKKTFLAAVVAGLVAGAALLYLVNRTPEEKAADDVEDAAEDAFDTMNTTLKKLNEKRKRQPGLNNMKRFTTSAQKTLALPIDDIVKKLQEGLSDYTSIKFEPTKKSNIKKAKLKDGSAMVIAGFEKGKNKTLAMIDYENLPATHNRREIQKQLRIKLDDIFK